MEAALADVGGPWVPARGPQAAKSSAAATTIAYPPLRRTFTLEFSARPDLGLEEYLTQSGQITSLRVFAPRRVVSILLSGGDGSARATDDRTAR